MAVKEIRRRVEALERTARPIRVMFAPPGQTAEDFKATLPDPHGVVVIDWRDAGL